MATSPLTKAAVFETRDGSTTQGTVRAHVVQTVWFDADIRPRRMASPEREQAEYVITVNGRVVKRLNAAQAERFGLLEPLHQPDRY